jgi:hypothetical protein
MTTTATYTKLHDGSWGVRVAGHARAGARIQVRRRDGSTRDETVARVIWHDATTSICSSMAPYTTCAPSTTTPRSCIGCR